MPDGERVYECVVCMVFYIFYVYIIFVRDKSAAAVVARAVVRASLVPQASLLLAVVVLAAKVDLPVSPAPQASRLVVENRDTY